MYWDNVCSSSVKCSEKGRVLDKKFEDLGLRPRSASHWRCTFGLFLLLWKKDRKEKNKKRKKYKGREGYREEEKEENRKEGIYIGIYGMVCPEDIQPYNMKNRDIYWKRYKIQETLYIRQWCLSPLQSRHLGISHSSPNHHQLPHHIFLNLTHGMKSVPFQRWF